MIARLQNREVFAKPFFRSDSGKSHSSVTLVGLEKQVLSLTVVLLNSPQYHSRWFRGSGTCQHIEAHIFLHCSPLDIRKSRMWFYSLYRPPHALVMR